MKRESSHAFSVELKSKEYPGNVMISDRKGEKVLVEGFLGELEEVSIVKGSEKVARAEASNALASSSKKISPETPAPRRSPKAPRKQLA